MMFKRFGVFGLAVFVVCGEVSSYGSEYYQTTEAELELSRKRMRHVCAKLGDGTIGVFGGFGVSRDRNVLLLSPDLKELEIHSVDARWKGRDISGIGLPNGNVLIIGGGPGDVYDYKEKVVFQTENELKPDYIRWATLTPLSNGQILVSGGKSGDFKPLKYWALFDPAQSRFIRFGEMALARGRHTATELSDGRVLIAGGRDKEVRPSSAEILDLDTGESVLLEALMCFVRNAHAAVLLNDGRVLIVGGWGPDDTTPCELFDPQTMDFEITAPLYQTRRSAQLWKCGNEVLVVGGCDNSRVVEIYDVEQEHFYINNDLLHYPRSSGFSLTPISESKAVIIGGRMNSGESRLNKIETLTRVDPVPADKLDAVFHVYEGETRRRSLPLFNRNENNRKRMKYQSVLIADHYLKKGVADCVEPRVEVSFSPACSCEQRAAILHRIGTTFIPSIKVVSDLSKPEIARWGTVESQDGLLPTEEQIAAVYPPSENKELQYTVSEYDPARDPFEDLKKTVEAASRARKNILLQVGGDWCGWCGTLTEFFHQNKAVKKMLADHYVIMKVSISEENRNEDFLAEYPRFGGVPHLFVLDSKGQLLHSQKTGPLEDGGSYHEEDMLRFLKKWVPAQTSGRPE